MQRGEILTLILCSLGIALSLTVLIWIARRRFYRRNPNGLQAFSSFSSAVINTFGEKLLKLNAWVLIIASLVLGAFILSFS